MVRHKIDERFDGDLPVEQQAEGPVEAPAQAEEDRRAAYNDAFADAIEADPEVQNFLVENLPQQEEEESASGGFWKGLAGEIRSVFTVDTARAVARGTTRAIDETLEFATEDIGGTLLAKTRVGRRITGLVFNEEEEDFFFDWYENRSTRETALFGNEFRENHLKYENDTFAVHMIEGITQFGVGFIGLGKVRGLAGAATAAGRLGQAAFRGGLIDFAAFDPQEQRLSDLIESVPALSNPVTRMLASDAEDSNMEGRIKNLFEGAVIGSSIDLFIEGVKGLRAVRRAKAGALDPEEALRQIEAHQQRSQEILDTPPPADDVVRAVETPDGGAVRTNTETGVREVEGGKGLSIETPQGTLKAVPEGDNFRVSAAHTAEAGKGIGSRLYAQLAAEVQERGGKLLSASAENRSGPADAFWRGLVKKGRASFDEVADEFTYIPEKKVSGGVDVPTQSLEDAQMQAEAINWQARRMDLPDGAEGVQAQLKEWQALTAKLEDTVDLESMLRVAEGTDIPLKYMSEPREIKAAVEALSDMMGPRAREVIGSKSLTEVADGMFHGLSPDQVLEWAGRTFGETADLGARMVGMRAYLIGHVKTVRQMAKQLDLAPENPHLATQLGRAMDTMYNLYADVAGTSSNVGRALESQKVDVGSLKHLPPELKEAGNVRGEYTAAKRAYESTLKSGDPEAIRASLQNLDDIGARMGELVGGRPKNKGDLAKTFDRDARRRAKGEQPQLEGMPPKPAVEDQLPAALKWYEDASARINKQIEGARAATIDEIPVHNPAPHRSFANMTKAEIRQAARMIFMQSDLDVNAVMGLVMSPKRKIRPGARSVKDGVLAARINLMLSGPQTHLTNSLNNIAFMHLRGLEFWWSGVSPLARRNLRGSGVSAREMRSAGSDLVMGYWLGLGEAWRNAKQSFRVGDNVLRPGTARDGLKQLDGMVSPDKGVVGGLWTIMNTPGRLLVTADEFAQQMSYRSNVRMQLLRQARREGVSDIGKFVTDNMKFAFTEDGRGTVANALRFSEEVTFKTPTEAGTLTKVISDAAQKSAIIRFVAPFIRTPANLIKRGYQRTPLAAKFSREISAELAAGGERAAIASAQIELGSALLGTMSIMAWNGMVTGRGPSEPGLRKQWLRQGNKPYSIRMPGTGLSVSYRRGDPIMMFSAAVADLTSVAGEIADQQIDRDEVLGALLASVSVSLGNKSYLQGATSVLEALSGGDPRKWELALQEATLSFTPALTRQLTFDDVEREINTFMDRIMNGIPGFSQTLEPRRNIFGARVLKAPGSDLQQLNPFTITFMNEEDREFNERIFEMGRAFSMPAKKMRVENAEIDLTLRGKWNGPDTPEARRNQSPYDRYMELMGTVRISGKTLEESLRELIKSEEFINAEKHGLVHEGGEAYILVSRELTTYQRVAFAGMIQEYPGIIDERARLLTLGAGELTGDPGIIERASQQ